MNLTIELDREKDGRWIAETLKLPGVMCYGRTRDETLSNAERLAIEVIADRIDHGELPSSSLSKSGWKPRAPYPTLRYTDIMSAAQNPHWVTIEEFDRIAAEAEDIDLELFEGEILEVTFPVWIHVRIQKRLIEVLTEVAAPHGEMLIEAPYQIAKTPRAVKRRADVAFVSHERNRGANADGILNGAPDLVIEVLSPSNSASRMNRLEHLCLSNGCQEFWTVDPEDQSIRVTRGSNTITYRAGESIPLPMFNADPLRVESIFEGIL